MQNININYGVLKKLKLGNQINTINANIISCCNCTAVVLSEVEALNHITGEGEILLAAFRFWFLSSV